MDTKKRRAKQPHKISENGVKPNVLITSFFAPGSQKQNKNNNGIDITKQEEQIDVEDLSNEYGLKRTLRPRKIENYRQLIEGDQGTLKAIEDEVKELKVRQIDSDEELYLDSFESEDGRSNKKHKNRLTMRKRVKKEVEKDIKVKLIDTLPNDDKELNTMLRDVNKQIRILEKQFFEEENSDAETSDLKNQGNIKAPWCIPLSVDVRSFDFNKLAAQQFQHSGRLFDIIAMDPPWQLSSANPTRGVAIAYETLNDREILNIPFNKLLADGGFLFIWVINAKYRFAIQLIEELGYTLVDEIVWVKQTVNGKIAKGHGYYLQHAKETCLVALKGKADSSRSTSNIGTDVIFSKRRGQSQKPEEIYDLAEMLVPNGYFLEIFGRRNNLHNGWVTVGNEI